MQNVDVVRQCDVAKTFRVQQVADMFDLQVGDKSTVRFSAELPAIDDDWQIGAIVGPSGSGKSTIASEAYGKKLVAGFRWPKGKSILDAFPDTLEIRDITRALTAVGLSSPPTWVKPYDVLSNGEKFRCDLARAMLTAGEFFAFDEYTSVVDRTVAKVGSAAIAKAIRKHKLCEKFVAVTCHYDVLEWLEVDWFLDMATGTLERRRLWRPKIDLVIRRVTPKVWPAFEPHHYLTRQLNKSAACFGGFVDDQLAAFCAVIHFPHACGGWWREHRTVVLPDFQGIGIGNALSDYVGSLFIATGKKYRDTTSHPGHCFYRAKSPNWRVLNQPRRATMKHAGMKMVSSDRKTMGFEYVGEARPADAKAFGVIP